MAFSFFSSWHAACSWFRTCQGSRKPQRNKSGACCNQRQLWHLTAFSAQWHHANKTSFGVSTDSAVSTGSEVGSRGDVGASSMRSGWKDSRGLCEGIKDIGCNVRISGRRKLNGIGRALWRPPLSPDSTFVGARKTQLPSWLRCTKSLATLRYSSIYSTGCL